MFLTIKTKYSVDNFKLNTDRYFLTHFHADHYQGLTSKFNATIFCSQTTANLAMKAFGIKRERFVILQLYAWKEIEAGRFVMAVDANHCPGAVCFVLKIDGCFYLHCGDFRCSSEFYGQFKKALGENQNFIGIKKLARIEPSRETARSSTFSDVKECENIDVSHSITNKDNEFNNLPNYFQTMSLNYSAVFLDNTYEGFKPFATQKETIHNLLRVIDNKLSPKKYLIPPRFCFLFATYCVGKEKVFLTVAEHLNYSIYANKYKMERLNCICPVIRARLHNEIHELLDSFERPYTKSTNVFNRLTNIQKINQIRLISMTQINSDKLHEITKDLECDRVCLFVGTGWHNKIEYKNLIRCDGRVIKSGIEIVYFPYSEHSSSDELVEFKKRIKSEMIINTVRDKGKVIQTRL